jgi:two-component system chemotaxis response regulator CheB
MDELNHIGRPSTFACPDCHGTLWQIDGARPVRYRCHTGHGFTLRSLEHAQAAATDEALWSALRALNEREKLLLALAADAREGQRQDEAKHYAASAERVALCALTLRDFVQEENR